MAIEFKSATEVAEEYLLEVKTIKPDVNVDQEDSDWWIRSRIVGGTVSGVYADQDLIANDAFPQRARQDAVERFLDLYFQGTFIQATPAQGNVIVTGDPDATIPAGMEFLYSPNGNTYQVVETTTLPSATGGSVTGKAFVTSVATGQSQNLRAFAALVVSSPPAGIQSAAQVDEDGLADARDTETLQQARERILLRIRQPLSVGRESDYIQYAIEADPAVVSASVRRYPFGLGTVGVYITSGTTDIDAAVDNGDDITIIPSDALVDTVQAYLEINKPVTDCVTVFKPAELPIDVTVEVRYKQGDGTTILTGQTLTQEELVIREVRRALYKTPVGGRVFDGVGYIVASEIEETIDVALSSDPVTVGTIPILLDRQVQNLAATGTNRMILPNEAPTMGSVQVITL